MTDHERARAASWLREKRGATSQQDLAAAISAATGWSITRDRYSKYESGSLPMGREVLRHFEDYWRAQGEEGPDFTPAPPPVDMATALRELAQATSAMAAELAETRREREALRDRLESVEATLAMLVSRTPVGQGSAARRAPDAHPA